MDKNIVELEGNITRDVEMKEDKKYCFVSIAIGRQRGSGSDFISVKAFKEVAVSCAGSLKKGDRVAVTGYVSSGSFIPKGGTEKIYRTDIVIATIRKIPKGGGTDGSGFIDDTQTQTESAGA